MAEDIESVIAEGRYFWELVFSYDTGGNVEIKHEYKVSRKHVVNYKQFMSTKFNITSGFIYDNKSSASIKFDGVGEGSDNVEFGFHIDTAYELERTSQTDETIDVETEETRDYTI